MVPKSIHDANLNIPTEVLNDFEILQKLFLYFACPAKNFENSDFYTLQDFENWRTSFLDNFENIDVSEQETAIVPPNYVVSTIERQLSDRTFTTILKVDDTFNAEIIARIQGNVTELISRILQGQLNCFISRAISVASLNKRRNRSFAFPHTLPYTTPGPTTLRGRATEEAAIIEASLNYVLSKRTNTSLGATLLIKRRSRSRNRNGSWTTGWGDVNSYNRNGYLEICLNDRAFPYFGDNTWTATIAHEILHNLGWSHGKGNYSITNAIEIYQNCIRNAKGLTVAEENEPKYIA